MGFALKGRQIIHVEVARVYGCPTPNLPLHWRGFFFLSYPGLKPRAESFCPFGISPLHWRRLAKAEGLAYGTEEANPFFEDEDDDEDEYEATTIREGRTVDLKRCHLADM